MPAPGTARGADLARHPHRLPSGAQALGRTIDFFSVNRSAILQSGSALLFSLTGFVAGLLLGFWTGVLEDLPGMIILVPVAIGMRGNIFGAMASRLGSKLHTGEIEPRFMSSGLGTSARVITSHTLVMSLGIAVLAFLLGSALGYETISIEEMVFISCIGGLLAAAPLFAATVSIATVSFRRGLDPDNVSVPMTTALGDFVTVPSLFAAAVLVLALPSWAVGAAVLALVALTIASFLLVRTGDARQIVHQSTPFLAISALMMVTSGLFLMGASRLIFAYPAILVLLPPFNNTSGSIGTILASRLSSAHFMGITHIERRPDLLARTNMLAVFAAGILIFPIVATVAAVLALASGVATPPLWLFIPVALAAGVLTASFAMLLSYYLTYIAVRIGYDPDNVVIGVLSSMMDLVGTGVILGLALVVL